MKNQTQITPEKLDELRNLHVMKDPEDLLILSGAQGELTAQLGSPERSAALKGSAFSVATKALALLRQGMSLPMWQRAAYETHKDAMALVNSPEEVAMAKMLWMIVVMLQSANANSVEWMDAILEREAAQKKGAILEP